MSVRPLVRRSIIDKVPLPRLPAAVTFPYVYVVVCLPMGGDRSSNVLRRVRTSLSSRGSRMAQWAVLVIERAFKCGHRDWVVLVENTGE